MVHDLSALGFSPFFARQVRPDAERAAIPARIAAEHRGIYQAWSLEGSGPARLAGRLRVDLPEAGFPGVGDWVLLDDAPDPERVAVINRVLARRTLFTRGAAGREARAQVIAANVDQVFVVCGLDGDFNLRRIERYLARVWASGAQPIVVLNKADLCEDIADRVAAVQRHVAGVQIRVTSGLRFAGIEPLLSCIHPGMTVALVGSSGAGKSTLVNALLGEERMLTGEVRRSDSRGRHVTTHRQLVLLPGGGLLLDTPGMRELQLQDEDGLDSVFGDVAGFAEGCRYRDCRHDNEPGCAVRTAVDSGRLAAERVEHFRKLQGEARAYEQRHDARLRRQSERVWGGLHKEAERLRRWKGGKP